MSAALRAESQDSEIKPKLVINCFGGMPKHGKKKRKVTKTFTQADPIIRQAGIQDRFVLMGLETLDYTE